MEDNDYSYGATEDSNSRVSYSQGSEDQGGDSTMADGGFSGENSIFAMITLSTAILQIFS